ncbi:MAG: Ppx/GppA family phosphatase [Synergistes sp.]|nr:Ppx/GppA family phosphatase [Synergistes sp.]
MTELTVMRKAAIDIGTNSIKLCIAEGAPGGSFTVIKDVVNVTKLGQGLKSTGIINDEALERNARAAAAYVDEAHSAGADVKIVGTMALRNAKNADAFIARVRELSGESVSVISGEKEAELLCRAVIAGVPGADKKDIVLFDAGGGSTEFAHISAGTVKRSFSLNIGCIRISEDYFCEPFVVPEKLAAARAQVRKELQAGPSLPVPEVLIGSGGNITALASVKHKMTVYDRSVIHCSLLTLDDVRSLITEFASKSTEERRKTVGLDPKRADVILGGACIVEAAMELYGAPVLTVSDSGLRYGVLEEMFSEDA